MVISFVCLVPVRLLLPNGCSKEVQLFKQIHSSSAHPVLKLCLFKEVKQRLYRPYLNPSNRCWRRCKLPWFMAKACSFTRGCVSPGWRSVLSRLFCWIFQPTIYLLNQNKKLQKKNNKWTAWSWKTIQKLTE